MRRGLHGKLIAALLAPVLLAGTAQGLFVRCGETLRMSCCCPRKATAPAPMQTLGQAPAQCCDRLTVPAVPVRANEAVASAAPAPTLVVTPGAAPQVALLGDRVREVPRLDPPPGPSIVLAHRALLI